MRKWVDTYLTELANEDSSIRLLIADVGDFPLFSQRHPDKFINVGVSESNCIGIASGLSFEGLRVFVYGVSSFFLYRAYEQLKYSVSYWRRNVTFIGVGFGWKYFNIGAGHFCPDDIALVKSLPFFRVSVPSTLKQLLASLRDTENSPKYIRLTANILPDGEESDTVVDSADMVIATYGEMVILCREVVKAINSSGDVSIGLMSIQSIDNEAISDLAERLGDKKVVVVEDHINQGGLFSRLLEKNVKVCGHINLPLCPDKVAETRQSLVKLYGMDKESIINYIMSVISDGENSSSSAVSWEKS